MESFQTGVGSRRPSLIDGLRTPTGLARDTGTGDLFVTEFGVNRIARVLVPR